MNIRNFLFAAVVGAVGAFSGMAYGQTTDAGAGGGAERGQRLDFLSRQDKVYFLRVRRQVFESNPELKTEAESLRKEVQSGTAEDKAALRAKVRAHMEKMDAAMVKADPTVQPILDQIKAHMKERFHAGGASAGGDDSANP